MESCGNMIGLALLKVCHGGEATLRGGRQKEKTGVIYSSAIQTRKNTGKV